MTNLVVFPNTKTGTSNYGSSSQAGSYGGRGTAVTAIPADGYHFVNWSDNSTANPRRDSNITANISVTANFAATIFSVN